MSDNTHQPQTTTHSSIYYCNWEKENLISKFMNWFHRLFQTKQRKTIRKDRHFHPWNSCVHAFFFHGSIKIVNLTQQNKIRRRRRNTREITKKGRKRGRLRRGGRRRLWCRRPWRRRAELCSQLPCLPLPLPNPPPWRAGVWKNK